jgi:signal transduction histidine kinase
MISRFFLRFSLTLKLYLTVLALFIIMGALVSLFIRVFFLNVIQSDPDSLVVSFAIPLATIVAGLLVSGIAGIFPLRITKNAIAAMNQLAKGDFSVRMNIKRPKELKGVATSFNHMAEELGSVEILRTDFVNNFSHEFKTPIVSIKGFAEELQNTQVSPEKQREYLDIIIKESDRLAQLATKVLDLSKIETQVILSDSAEFNLSEQIRQAIIMLEIKWENKNIMLGADLEEITFCGNEDMLGEVWLNLLDNAIKFTPNHGTIDVSLAHESNRIVFRLKDSGHGMNTEETARVFDKFYQADTSHKTQGTGLGLSIAQRIVELHRGKVEVISTPENGSEFIVWLPLL